MAIRVEHGPSMVPVGRLAYRTGQNEYINRRRRELESLREQQADRQMRAAMQVSDINAGFQRLQMQNAADQQQMQQQQQFQMQMMQAGQQFDQQQAQQQNEWLNERVELGHENAVNLAQMGNQFDLDRMEREYELEDQEAAKRIRQAKRAKREQERWGKYNTQTKDLITSLQQQKKDIKKSSELNDEQKQAALDEINAELKEIERAVPGDGSDYFKDAHLQAGYYGPDPNDPRRHLHNKEDGQGGYEQIVTPNLDKGDGTRYESVPLMMLATGMAGTGRTKDGQDVQFEEDFNGNVRFQFGKTAADRKADQAAFDQQRVRNQIDKAKADAELAQVNQQHMMAARQAFLDLPQDMIPDPNDSEKENPGMIPDPSGSRGGGILEADWMKKYGSQKISTDLPKAEDGIPMINEWEYTSEQLEQVMQQYAGQRVRINRSNGDFQDVDIPGRPAAEQGAVDKLLKHAEGIDGMPMPVVLRGLGDFMNPRNRQDPTGKLAGAMAEELQKIPGGEKVTAEILQNASQNDVLMLLLDIARENNASQETLQSIMKKAERFGVKQQLVP